MAEYDYDEIHGRAYEDTGYWGRRGAGCLVLARSTGRFLVAQRGEGFLQPGTWGTWGGAVDPDEEPEAAVLREVAEETLYDGPVEEVVPLLVYRDGGFEYRNFLVVVPDEFDPDLDGENADARWCAPGDWPPEDEMHFGLKALLADEASSSAMEVTARASLARSR